MAGKAPSSKITSADVDAFLNSSPQPKKQSYSGPVTSKDVDAFLSTPAPKEKVEISTPEAFVRGGVQGATFGFGDEISGALGGVASAVKGEGFKKGYESERDRIRNLNQQAAEQHPVAYGVGDFSSMLLPAKVAISGGSKVLKAAGLGAVSGAGLSEEKDVAGVAKDTAIGAGTGAAFQGLSSTVSKAVDALAPESLKKKAGEWATKALGNETSKTERLVKQKGGAADFGNEVRQLGIVGGTKQEMLEKATSVAREEGAKIGKIYEQLDEIAAARKLAAISSNKIVDRIEKEVLKPLEGSSTKAPLADQVRSLFLDRFKETNVGYDPFSKSSFAKGSPSFRKLHEEAMDLGERAYEIKKIDTPLSEQLQKAQRIVRDELLKDAARVTENVKPNLVKELLEANKKDSYAITARQILQDKVGRDSKNRGYSLTDTIVGTGGATLGGIAGGDGSPEGILKSIAYGLAAGKANQLARNRGPGALSNTYASAAKLLENSPAFARKFGNILDNAAKDGAAGVAAAHQALMQNQIYKKMVEDELNSPKEGE